MTTTNEKGEVEGVKYDRIGVVLVNAVQEQQLQIEVQERRIDEQNQLIKLQNEKLEMAEKQLQTQKSEFEALKTFVCSQNPTAEFCKPKN